MTYTTFIKLKDHSITSPLWNGEEIILLAETPLSINSSNLTTVSPKTFQVTSATQDSDDWKVNYNRRKSNVSYSGFNNHRMKITVWFSNLEFPSGNIILNDITYKVLTPNKLMELVLKPRTLYLTDTIITPLLSVDESTTYGPAIYSSKGIPVILESWDINGTTNPGEIIMNLNFVEDTEI